MKKIKWIALIMVAILTCTAFAGCNKEEYVNPLEGLSVKQMSEIYTDEAFEKATASNLYLQTVDNTTFTTVKALTTLTYADYQASDSYIGFSNNNERLLIKETTSGSDVTRKIYDMNSATPETAILTVTNKEVLPIFFGDLFVVYESASTNGEVRRTADAKVLGEVNRHDISYYLYQSTDSSYRVENHFKNGSYIDNLYLKYNKDSKLVEVAEAPKNDFINKSEIPAGYNKVNDDLAYTKKDNVITFYSAKDWSMKLTYTVPVDADAYIELFTLNNGNVLIQATTNLDYSATEYDFEDVDNGIAYKANIDHFLYTLSENTVQELDLGYYVEDLDNNRATKNNSKYEMYVEGIDNVLFVRVITENKKLDYAKIVTANDALNLTSILITQYTGIKEIYPYAILGNAKYYRTGSGFINQNGDEIDFYTNPYPYITDNYLIDTYRNKIYTFDGSIAYDANKDGYEMFKVYNGVVLLRKNAGGHPRYATFKNASVSGGFAEGTTVYTYNNFYATVTPVSGGSEEIKLYNANGSLISNVPENGLTYLKGRLGCGNGADAQKLYVLA